MRISDLNLNYFSGVKKIEGEMIEVFYMINIANSINVRYNENTGIVQSLKINGNEVPLDNPEIIGQVNAALEAEKQRQQKLSESKEEKKYKVTKDDLTPVALYGVRKIEGDIIETFNMINISTTIRVRYNNNSGEVYFIKVNGNEIPLDNPEIISNFNEALETLVPPTNINGSGNKHL